MHVTPPLSAFFNLQYSGSENAMAISWPSTEAIVEKPTFLTFILFPCSSEKCNIKYNTTWRST